MKSAFKIVASVFGLMFTLAGAAAMLAPRLLAARFAVDTHRLIGLGTLRGVLGGLLFGGGSLILLGLVRGETVWLRAAAIVVGSAAAGRIIGLVFDGPSADTVLPVVVELSVVAASLAASARLGGKAAATS